MKKRTTEQRKALRSANETYQASWSAANVARWASDSAVHDYIHGKIGAAPLRLIRTARKRMAEFRKERALLDALLESLN
jgi:hypothetical protein